MTFPRKITVGAALAAVFLMGVAAIDTISPVKHRYNTSKPWFVETEPDPSGAPHDWTRFFPYEPGQYGMLHIPDSFEFNGRTIEIVQGNEKDNYEVRKEIFVNPVAEENFSSYLYNLHMIAADMVIEEQYKTKNGLIKMTGYSVDTEHLKDGTFLGRITLYTKRPVNNTES